MKILLGILTFLAALVIWQAGKLKEQSKTSVTAPPLLTVDYRSQKESRLIDGPMLPAPDASRARHRDHAQTILEMSASTKRAQATESWIESLRTVSQLETVLDSLLEAPFGERSELLRTFGPSLMSQWGQIEPRGGLLKWARLERSDQWLLDDIDPLRQTRSEPYPPFPSALLDSWISSNADGLFREISREDSFFLSKEALDSGLNLDLGKPFAKIVEQKDIISVVRLLNTASESSALPIHTMSSLSAEKLVSENGGDLNLALKTAQKLPNSPGSVRLVMDLTASQLAQQMIAASEKKGGGGGGEVSQFVQAYEPLLRGASEAGRNQFFQTLEKSAEYFDWTSDGANLEDAVIHQLRAVLEGSS